MNEGSWVGFDVHARSVVAGVIDGGAVRCGRCEYPSGNGETAAWLETLPATPAAS